MIAYQQWRKLPLLKSENEEQAEKGGVDQLAPPEGANRERLRLGDEPGETAEQYW